MLPRASLLGALLLAVWPSDRPTAAQARISDNSLLMEEAYNLGASVIWLRGPTFNVMVEIVWTAQSDGTESVVVNPGIRWAHNFASGLQIVPGIAFPFDVGPFLYLSFEHRFRPARGVVNSNN
jgi:hypothetical protein